MGERITDTFLSLFCEKNSDGTKKLRLKGNELIQRIGKRLVSSDMKKVANFLKQHPEINELNLCYNCIGDDGLEILCRDFLEEPNNLEYLNIMGCDLTIKGLTEFYFTSEKLHVGLKTLRLSSNRFGPHGGHLIALLIPIMTQLEYLDFGDTQQTPESVDNIFLNLWWSQIKVLDISRVVPNCETIVYDPTELAESVEELFRLNNTLVDFHAQKCGFDAHDLEMMVIGFTKNTSLLFLDLAYNDLHDFGIELMAKWLETRPNLIALNIAGNKMMDPAAMALSKSLPFSKIRYLDVSNNEATDEGMMALLSSIKKPYRMRFFYMWGNKFGPKTLAILARLLKATVLDQEGIDVKIYMVDGVYHAAKYTVDHYKHRYYEVMDHGCATELKIKRNRVEKKGEEPRALLNFHHVSRFPPLFPK